MKRMKNATFSFCGALETCNPIANPTPKKLALCHESLMAGKWRRRRRVIV
jgi:hypothetical protein